MEESEDNFNCHLKNVTLTYPDGKETQASAMFVRGNQICFIIMPSLLQHAPVFRRVLLAKKGKTVGGGLGMGRQQAIRAKGSSLVPAAVVTSSRAASCRVQQLCLSHACVTPVLSCYVCVTHLCMVRCDVSCEEGCGDWWP